MTEDKTAEERENRSMEDRLSRDSDDSDSQDIKSETKEETAHKFSEKGKKMAASLGEIVLMKFFFPELRDRKRQQIMKNLFMLDMQFNLSNGRVIPASKRLMQSNYRVSLVYNGYIEILVE